jgi:antitoxin HicB
VPAKEKGSIDRSETFDEFLARDGLLGETEEAALKQIMADQSLAAMTAPGFIRTAIAKRPDPTNARSPSAFGDRNQPHVWGLS